MSKQNADEVEVSSENFDSKSNDTSNDEEEKEFGRGRKRYYKKEVLSEEELEEEIEINEEVENFAIIPPNGGWGWVVVACAFYINVVADGIQLTFGVFLDSISKTFKVEYSAIALAGSLMFGVHLLMGPICAGFSGIFGLRPVTIAGALICCFGVGVTYFANCHWFLYISYGLIGGIGLGLVYMNSLVITSLYFTSLLPLAIGIVTCGTGFGTMIFALFGDFLLRITTWQNSFLIQGALAGSMALAAISFRPLKPIRVKLSLSTDSHPHRPYIQEESHPRSSKREAFFIKKDIHFKPSATSMKTLQSLGWNPLLENLAVAEVKRKRRCLSECVKCRKREGRNKPEIMVLTEKKSETPYTRRKSYVEKERSSSQIEEEMSSFLNMTSYTTIYTRVEYEEKLPAKGCGPFKKTLITMLDCHLLGSCAFLLFTISGALQVAAMLIIFIYEKDRCKELGFTEQVSVYFVVCLGASNMLWRLILGGIALVPNVNYKALTVAGTIIGGIATSVSGLSSSIYYQFAFCIFFGLGLASFAVFRLIFLIDLVGVELVANGTGINLLFMGVFCIVAPPIFGWAMEETNSFNVIFVTTGILVIIGGLMLIGLKKLRHRELRRINKRRSLAAPASLTL